MGCGASKTSPIDDLARQRNDQIEKQLQRDSQRDKKTVKVLLLGSGESGKSTMIKQMRLLYGKPYAQDERLEYVDIIASNAIQSMEALLSAMDLFELTLSPPVQPAAQHIEDLLKRETYIHAPLSPDTIDAVKILWQSSDVQTAYSFRAQFQLNDSSGWFFDHIERIGRAGYVPTDEDILRARVKTTGIIESEYQIKQLTWRIIDVGGQRSERRKWVNCFEGVQLLLFLVAISEYDRTLYEDESANRLKEAETLFDSIANSRWFSQTVICLLLNKTDLFAEKPASAPLREHLPEYTGPNEFEPAALFLKQRFENLRKATRPALISHLTCATDRQQTKVVLTAIQDIVVNKMLKEAFLI